MDYRIHFKITHGGVTRRFALSRDEDDLLSALRRRVHRIIEADGVSLFWKDDDSIIVLDADEDLHAAIDFAQTQNKLACVSLVTGADRRENERQVVTKEESSDTFDGVPIACDGCDCFMAESNGGRFKCTICNDFDMCAACFAKRDHANHAFVHLTNGNTEVPMLVNGRWDSTTAKATYRCTPKFFIEEQVRSRDREASPFRDARVVDTKDQAERRSSSAERRQEEFNRGADEAMAREEAERRRNDDERLRSEDENFYVRRDRHDQRRGEDRRGDRYLEDAVQRSDLQEPASDRENASDLERGGRNARDVNESPAESEQASDQSEQQDRYNRGRSYSNNERGGRRYDMGGRYGGGRGGRDVAAHEERGGGRYEADLGFNQRGVDVPMSRDWSGRDVVARDGNGREAAGGYGGGRGREAVVDNGFSRREVVARELNERERQVLAGFGRGGWRDPADRDGGGRGRDAVDNVFSRREAADREASGFNNRRSDEEEQQPAGREYYSSRYGGASGVRDQGGWQADRRDRAQSARENERNERRQEQDEAPHYTERRNGNFNGRRSDFFERNWNRRSENRYERGGRGYPDRISSRDFELRPERNVRGADRQNEMSEDETAYLKASQMPAHMAMAVCADMKGLFKENMDSKLTMLIDHIMSNTYDIAEHRPIFTGRADQETYLIGNIAVDLQKHLRDIQLVVRKLPKNKDACAQLMDDRINVLRRALRENRTDGESYATTAIRLRDILLTDKYRYRRGPTRGNWTDVYVGFMEEDAKRERRLLPRVASANPREEGTFAKRGTIIMFPRY